MSHSREYATDARQHRPMRGIALATIGIGFITFNDALMKLVVDERPIGQAIFVRGLFTLVPIALLVYRAGGGRVLRVYSWRWQFLCAALLVGPLFLFVYSISQLPLAVATIVSFTNPLFVALLAPMVLRERVDKGRLLAVMVGFIGVLFIVQPGGTTFQWIALGPLAVAFLTAVRELVLRVALARDTSESMLLISTVSVTVIALTTWPFGWPPMSALDALLLAGAALGFGFGIYATTEALRFAEASLLSTFKYTAVVWALVLAFLIWGDVPTLLMLVGAALITASGLYVLARERRATR